MTGFPELSIRSHRGDYRVRFGPLFSGLESGMGPCEHLIIDEKVARLHADRLGAALSGRSVLRVEAGEANKSLERLPEYASFLIERGIRRNHVLVAVGGGVVQDITSFLAAVLLRGLAWRFYPTTLLAQADSCIGSKSSINVGPYKNQLGTFTPPDDIRVSTEALRTLPETDLRSGFGEMIKAHVLSGWEDARALLRDYPRLSRDRELLERSILRSLEIKKRLVEADEFDRGERLVLNYGHSFGHAIESATEFRVPHGIAVTMGMDLANRLSERLGFMEPEAVRELQPVLDANSAGFDGVDVPLERFIEALLRDKKNSGASARLVLLRGPGRAFLHSCAVDGPFLEFCGDRFRTRRGRAGEAAAAAAASPRRP